MAGEEQCPVCQSPAEVSKNPTYVDVKCSRCGKFSLFRTVYSDLPEYVKAQPFRAALMSHTIRRMQREGERIKVEPSELESYWRGHLATPNAQRWMI